MKTRKLTRKSQFQIAFLLLLCGLFAFGYSMFRKGPQQMGTNVVILLIDTLRADHTSLHGYHRDTTPNLQRIAEQALTLRAHLVNSSWTKPSVASIITGLLPTAHGSRMGQFEEIGTDAIVEILSERHITMAEAFQAAGYNTFAFVTNPHLSPKFGYDQGYDTYHFEPGGTQLDKVCDSDRASIEKTIRALRKSPRPVFIWCHLMSVHQYRSPAGSQKFQPEGKTPIDPNARQVFRVAHYDYLEEAVAEYDNSIFYADYLLGELFDFIVESRPNTMLIVTSDHGEEFYEHGGYEHVRTLYSEIMHCPCVVYGPGVPQGEITGLTDSVDLFPTLGANLNIDIASQLPGEVLFSGGKLSSGKKEVFAEKHQRDFLKWFALVRDGKKLIVQQHKETGKEALEFYPDGLGPEEDGRIHAEDRQMVDTFKQRLDGYRTLTADYFREHVSAAETRVIDPQDLESIRALGYGHAAERRRQEKP